MASKQDIINAIKNLDIFLKIPKLKGAKPRLNENGSPFAFVGGFNMVFQLVHNSKKWAFRVWHVPMGENKDRYLAISKFLTNSKLPYFADFKYDVNGLLVNGVLTDTIRMEWLEGILLKDYIEKNLKNKLRLESLANDFLIMTSTLRDNKISHGDLQEGNILIESNGKIRLVDYDSICIPEIEGQKEIVTGLKGYQHPSRFKEARASLKADYFSELVIYLSILAIAENPTLWVKYQIKDTQYLLFNEDDFSDFEKSDIFKDLSLLNYSIKLLTTILLEYLNEKSYLNLTPFSTKINPPKINTFRCSNKLILKNNEVELFWNIEEADLISIDQKIGKVNAKDSIKLLPVKTSTYKLTAINAFGKKEEEVIIEVLPQPIINLFKTTSQKIEHGNKSKLIWNIENGLRAELHYNGIMEIVDFQEERYVSPLENTDYCLKVIALDGLTQIEKKVSIDVFKRIIINRFESNLDFVIESLPVHLKWEIENASSIILSSNNLADIDVSGKNEIEIKINRSTYFYLKASNELLSQTSSQIKVEVQALPSMPRFENIIPTGKDFLPNFELNFKEISSSILTQTQIDFQSAMKTKSKFSLIKSLTQLLNK